MDNKDHLQLASELGIDHEEIEIIGIHTICRLCASQNERLIGIFSEEGVGNDLSNKINLYLPVKVAVSDELPLQCCWNCASTILAWHELVLTSVETDRRFRSSQFITDKQMIEDVVYDSVANPPSDDNDGSNPAHGNILALFEQITQDKEDKAVVEEAQTATENPTCEICEKSLSSRANYLSHLKTHISDNFCPICCNSYNTKFKLDTHLTCHEPSPNPSQTYVACDFANCDRQFPSKLQLHNHKNEHSNSSRFGCDVCGTKFSRKAALENHKSRHDRPSVCQVCDKTFANKKTLKEHERLHSGEKPYECGQCDRKFRCHSGLKYHEVSHTNDRKYECRPCGVSFARSNYLKEHLRRHSNEKPFQCRRCPEKFIQLNVLRRHESTKHRKCDVCEEVVGRAKELREHKWKQHGFS
ncbi:zinc finger protein 391-like isoform X3 [Tenebrio molitor]|uniref:zinc finger protein 391-like isoform X3 n=1 Tax=Tenebrio molitor TaxID=7067 RepID=UPI0036247327